MVIIEENEIPKVDLRKYIKSKQEITKETIKKNRQLASSSE